MKNYLALLIFALGFAIAGLAQQAAPTPSFTNSTGVHKDSAKYQPYSIERVTSLSTKFKSKRDSLFYDIDDFMAVRLNRDIDSIMQSRDTAILWLNNQPFANLKVWQYNSAERTLIFKLQRDLSPRSSWNMFYAYSVRGLIFNDKKVTLAVGFPKKKLTKNYKEQITIAISSGWMLFMGLLFMVLITVLFIIASKRSNILRANLNLAPGIQVIPVVTDPTTQIAEKDIPYSLGRFQLAWWTYLIIMSFIYIWMCTDELGNLPDSIALLMGITGGTSIVSKISESLKISGPGAAPITIDQFNTNFKSKHFIYDVISDENGISVSRFQFLFFSVFFGLFLVWQVIYNLQFPDFPSGILLLMGISSTTYAGVKFGEK